MTGHGLEQMTGHGREKNKSTLKCYSDVFRPTKELSLELDSQGFFYNTYS